MSRALPRKPHIDSLKKQARQLLQAHREGRPESLRSIRTYMPHLGSLSDEAVLQRPFTLQQAQCVLSREYGFSNWAELVRAVEIIRQAESAMLSQVDAALSNGQSIHVLIPEHMAADIAQKLTSHCGQDRVFLVLRVSQEPFNVWIDRIAAAAVVVSPPGELGFLHMHERLQKPEGSLDFEQLLSEAHAFVNVPFREERTPLIISGPDEETGVVHDLISMYLTEFYGLYGSMIDHRY